MAIQMLRKDVTLQREKAHVYSEVRKDVMFLKEKWDVSIRRPHNHITFLIEKGGKFILKIRRDVTLLRKERDVSTVRVSKAVRLLA